MLKNYFKIAFRNLKKNKAFSSINILGFAFGISICMMIVLYLMKEYSFDDFNMNADHIYRLVDAVHNSSQIDYRVEKALTDNFPQVKNACFVDVFSKSVDVNYNDNAYYINSILSTDNNFFKMFTVPFIYGNPQKPFQNINSVVLTESTAKKIFGNNNPLGKEIVIRIRLRPESRVVVTGVIKDFPDNSSIQANIIVNAENNDFKFYFSADNSDDVSSYRWLFNIYLQLNKNTDSKNLVLNINRRAELLAPYEKQISLLPLKEIYLNDDTFGGFSLKGNPVLLNLMASIALIVLLLAVINYVNLTVARQNKRNKETGIRKTIGANRNDMIILFLAESILVTIIAFGIALVILELVLPFFSRVVNSSLSIGPIITFPAIFILVFSVLFVGILAGMGPALILSSFNPVKILNGGLFSPRRKSFFRNALIVFQFAVSIGLIFCIIVIQKQIGFVKHKNLGFNKEQLLRIDLPGIRKPVESKIALLTNRIKLYPGIKNTTLTMGVPGSIFMKMGSGIKGKEKHFAIIIADSSFLKTFGIKQKMGRSILPGDIGNVCMINEAAYKYFRWTNLKNKRYNNGKIGGYKVIGVVNDFNYASMHSSIEPLCIIFDLHLANQINVRISKGAVAGSLGFIQKTWKEILPDYPLKYQFYDEWFDAMYRKEDRLAQTIGLFALLAISISCLGILGLAIFSSESRSKEIGIRKVHGAQIKDIILMLNKDFIKWVLVAFIIAAPTGWLIMKDWLADFAFRTEINWWIFVLSGTIALVIAFLTVSWQTWRTAKANPVKSLRYE